MEHLPGGPAVSGALDELRAAVDAIIARAASREAELVRANDYLTKENRSLYSQLHAFQDAKTEPPAAEEDRQG